MKKYSIVSIFTVIMVFLTIRCSEDFLELKPLSIYAPENTFTNPAALNSALIACLRNARHEYYGDSPMFISEGIFSDIAVEGTTDKTGVHMDMPAQILPAENMDNTDRTKLGRYWTEGYKRIKYANTVVSRIDYPEWESEAQRNHILGKAYFHR